MENRYNLIDEPWIPVADVGRVSLKQIFSNPDYRTLGGNPVQKIAILKLLLAVTQAAATPEDHEGWKTLGPEGLAMRCFEYLENWRDRFYLFGEQPFLQMPAIAKASVQSYGAVLPEVSTGNTTVLNQGQVQSPLEDADKAVLLVTLMGFALSGKKTDNSIVLTPGYQGKTNPKGKPASGKPGPSVAYLGLLHSFFIGKNLQKTLWLNLLTSEQIARIGMFPGGVGIAPWERMPEGEDCPIARELKMSLMGRLLPLCRFCLLKNEGLHYSEGLAHAGYKEGVADPSIAVDFSGKAPKALWVDPEKRPWRELTSLLGFLEQDRGQGYQCSQIGAGLDRARDAARNWAIWSGGLRVSSNAGEQYASGSDDYVESVVWLQSDLLGSAWFAQLKSEMEGLDELAKGLYGRVIGYFKEQNVDAKHTGGKIAAQATHQFWQLCERKFQYLVNCCDQGEHELVQRQQLRQHFASNVIQVYDHFCPRGSARQLDAWAKCRPNNSMYLKKEG